MNIYDDFFKGITPDDWELFAEDFFSHMGFDIITAPSICLVQNKKEALCK